MIKTLSPKPTVLFFPLVIFLHFHFCLVLSQLNSFPLDGVYLSSSSSSSSSFGFWCMVFGFSVLMRADL